MKQKRDRAEQKRPKQTEKFEQEKARGKVEMDIEKKLIKEYLQQLFSQLERDFDVKNCRRKEISTYLSSRGRFFEKNKR